MIDFILGVPWWGWLIVLVLFVRFIFISQMAYVDKMTPEQRQAWMKEQASKKPWYMQ